MRNPVAHLARTDNAHPFDSHQDHPLLVARTIGREPPIVQGAEIAKTLLNS